MLLMHDNDKTHAKFDCHQCWSRYDCHNSFNYGSKILFTQAVTENNIRYMGEKLNKTQVVILRHFLKNQEMVVFTA